MPRNETIDDRLRLASEDCLPGIQSRLIRLRPCLSFARHFQRPFRDSTKSRHASRLFYARFKADELIAGVSEVYATVITGGRYIPAGMWPVIDGGLSAAQHVLSNFRNAFGEAIAFEVRRVLFQHMSVRMGVWYNTSLIAEVTRTLIGIKMFIGRFGRPADEMSQVVEAFGMSSPPVDPYSPHCFSAFLKNAWCELAHRRRTSAFDGALSIQRSQSSPGRSLVNNRRTWNFFLRGRMAGPSKPRIAGREERGLGDQGITPIIARQTSTGSFREGTSHATSTGTVASWLHSTIAAKGLVYGNIEVVLAGRSTSTPWGRCSRLGQQLLDDPAWIDADGLGHVDELGHVEPACGPFDLGDERLLTTEPLGQLPLRQPLLLSRRFQEFGALLVEL